MAHDSSTRTSYWAPSRAACLSPVSSRVERMAFPDSVKDMAFRRSAGRCECRQVAHPAHPSGRCVTNITRHSAEYHQIQSEASGGSDFLTNCKALCRRCHQLTPSYGN